MAPDLCPGSSLGRSKGRRELRDPLTDGVRWRADLAAANGARDKTSRSFLSPLLEREFYEALLPLVL